MSTNPTSMMRLCLSRPAAAALVASAGLCLSAGHAMAQVPAYNAPTLLALPAPAGSPNIYTSASGGPSGLLQFLTSSGTAAGRTNRFNGATALGADTWYYNGSTIAQIGYTGGVYEQTNGSRTSSVLSSNGSNLFGGTSQRFQGGTTTSLGQDAWLFDATANTTTQLGLTSNGTNFYAATVGANTTRSSSPSAIASGNNAVIGSTNRYFSATSTTQVGQDIWSYNPSTSTYTVINPVGTSVANSITANYTNPSGATAGARNPIALAVNVNATGQVLGTASRYSSTGGNLGTDAWVWDGTTATIVGLSGSNYTSATGQRISAVPVTTSLNASGQAIGSSTRLGVAGATTGTDSWIYTPGSGTTQIGVTGGVYLSTSGLQQSAPTRINSTGRVIGTSNRFTGSFTQIGQDAWYYNGTTSVIVSPTTPMYVDNTGATNANASALTNSGFAAGSVARSNGGAALSRGTDTWVYDGGSASPTTTIISMPATPAYAGGGNLYEKADGTHSFTFRGLTESGIVFGSSTRYDSTGTSIGSAGWIYDAANPSASATIIQFPSFSVANANGGQSATTTPAFVTSAGNVLGTYTLYDNAGVSIGNRVFAWSATDGYSDIGGLVTGGLSAANWDRLSSLTFQTGQTAGGYPTTFVGTGRQIGQTADGALYIVAIPAPTTAAVLGLGGLFASRRRRD